MAVFQQILDARNHTYCPLPLWKLKLTSREYELLRDELKDKAVSRAYHLSNPFLKLAKECTLFFAEYWRREYKDGAHSKQMVFDALGTGSLSYELVDYFYDAAVMGARELNIEQYWGGRSDPLNDMLYQGGLPMKLVTGNETNSVWDRFTRGLVNRHVDFEELNLGVVAQQSNSLKEYCDQLIQGIETEHFQFMPFYCENKNNGWFIYLKELANQERVRHRHAHPFSLDWEFSIDFVEKRINTKYIVRGMQRLPQVFLEDNQLLGKRYFLTRVHKNGNIVDTFEFVNNFCRYAVVSKHPYYHDDVISVYIDDNANAQISDTLDLTVPHILYLNKENKYTLGNHMGLNKTLILFPNNWKIVDSSQFEIINFLWERENDGNQLSGISLPEDFVGEVVLKSSDDEIIFSKDTSMSWTELQSHPIYLPDVVEQLYDASSCRFLLSIDSENGTKSVRTDRIQYRDKTQTSWSSTPSYGEIFARATGDPGMFVTPTKFINVGDGLNIGVVRADQDTCDIRISWTHGRVTSGEGQKKSNNIWTFEKVNCADPHHLIFTLIPTGNSRNQFNLTLKAPFKEFAIIDIHGDNVISGSYIPYTDIDKYIYHLVGQNIRVMKFGNITQQLRWYEGNLYIFLDGEKQPIPYEGSLLTLFGTRERLRYMLDRTSQNHLNAEIPVSFITEDRQQLNFIIKEFPYRPCQVGEDVIMTIKNTPIKFNGALKLMSIHNPTIPPIVIQKENDSMGYHLPEVIKAWGMTLLYGRSRGRVSPGMVDLSRDWSVYERRLNYQSSIERTQHELENAKFDDNIWNRIIVWFERSQRDDIPASSLTDLVAVAKNGNTLMLLAFMLYVKCENEEKSSLIEQLKAFSADLAFSWYWMRPNLDNILPQLSSFITIDSNYFKEKIYIKWAIQQKEQAADYLLAINSEDYFNCALTCVQSIIDQFYQWMIELCIASLVESYEGTEEKSFHEIGKLILNNEEVVRIEIEEYNLPSIQTQDGADCADEFFSSSHIHSFILNERKLLSRIDAVVAQLKRRSNVDLFSLPENARRSIIFYSKANNERFICELNNRLLNNI